MSVKRALAGARFRIPEPYRHVNAPRRKPAVFRKSHGKDIRAAKSLKKNSISTRTVAGFTGPEGSHL